MDKINNIDIVQDEQDALKALKDGKTICRYEYGDSMFPIFKSGEYAKLVPSDSANLGDVVFCEVYGQLMTHYVTDTYERNGQKWYQISSTDGYVFGWTDKIYALAYPTNIFVEKD